MPSSNKELLKDNIESNCWSFKWAVNFPTSCNTMDKSSIDYNSNINILIPQNMYLLPFNVIKCKLLTLLVYVLVGGSF